MEELRNCPICFRPLSKIIFQCSEGHIICNSCTIKMKGSTKLCPQCRKRFEKPKIRNRVLEQLLNCTTTRFRKKLESFHCCPNCTKVFGEKIYQCKKGHITCPPCKTNSGDVCPQCFAGYGSKKNGIRNRALEEILDLLDFPCNFKEQGCDRVGKRDEIMGHHDQCLFNPDRLCRGLGFENCMFRLSTATRSEVLSHLEEEHAIPFKCVSGGTWFPVSSGTTLMKAICGKRKANDSTMPTKRFCEMIGFARSDMSPLFLLNWKIETSSGCLAVSCIQVRTSGNRYAEPYQAEFSFAKRRSSTSKPKPISFPNSDTVLKSIIPEADHVLKAVPINFPISVLESSGFGNNSGDYLNAKIAPDRVANNQ